MPKYNLPKSRKLNNKFITISQAASILKVSADTLRNWEKDGKLIPERTVGGARRYSANELYELKKEIFPKKIRKVGLVSVSKAAKQLRISPDTLRNWENKGLVESYRTKGGARRFGSAEIKRIREELGIEPLPPEPVQIPNSRHEIPKFSFNLIKIFSFLGFILILLTLSWITWIYSQSMTDNRKEDKSSDILGEKTQDLENMLFNVVSSLETLQKQVFDIQSSPDSQTSFYQLSDKIYNDLLPQASNAINLGSLNNYFKEAFITKIFGKVADYDEIIADRLQTKKLQLDNINLYSNSGNPESNLGDTGDFYFRKDGTSGNSSLYFKTLTGWISTDSQSLQSVYEAGNELTLLGADNNFIVNDELSDQTPFVITSSGNLGIGKSDPQTKLHLVENLTTAVTGGISVENDQAISNIDLFRVISDVGGVNNVKAKITSDGDLFLDGSITASSTTINSGNADLAEDYNVLDNAQEGDVVVLTGGVDVLKSAFPYQKSILGVISENPGIKLSSGPEGNFLNPKAVALAGRVKVKVSLENGPIERGDFLTSSSISGAAMKATRPGPTIGKALESFKGTEASNATNVDTSDASKVGKILVFVNISFADPNDLLAALSLDDQGNLIVPKIKVGRLTLDTGILKQDLEAGSSSIDNQASKLRSQNLASSIRILDSNTTYYDLTGKIASLEERIAELEVRVQGTGYSGQQESTSSAQVASGQETATDSASIASNCTLQPETCSPREAGNLNLTPPDILLATQSASLADISIISNAEISGKLTSYEAEIKDSFKVLGETILAKTIIAGDLTVDGIFSIESGSIINSIPALFIQKSSQANLVDFFDGKITLDRDGTLKAASVIVAEFKVLANKISGSAKIPKGERQIKVENKLIKEDSRILITPTSEIDSVLAVTKKLDNEGFVVSTAKILVEDATFDWWVIGEVKEEVFTDN